MFNQLAKLFGYVPKQRLDETKSEIASLRRDIIKISNIIGALAKKVDTATTVSKQNAVTLKTLSNVQAELAMEFVALFDGLQTVSSKKNIGIGFSSLTRDDDDDLLN